MSARKSQVEDGEPRTMARVQGMIEERWPKRPYNCWIENGKRHVAIAFRRSTVEGVGTTWLAAFDDVDAVRKKYRV